MRVMESGSHECALQRACIYNNLEREYKDCIKKQKRQDWDHKAYHDAPSAI